MSYDQELKHLEVRLAVQQKTVERCWGAEGAIDAEEELERIHRSIQQLEERRAMPDTVACRGCGEDFDRNAPETIVDLGGDESTNRLPHYCNLACFRQASLKGAK